jgi:hypothetical protein
MNTQVSLENKNAIKALKTAALERAQREKEQLRRDLEKVETIYVVYLNESGSEMDFYFVNKDNKEKYLLDKVWITRPYYFDNINKDEYGLDTIVELPFNDKPSNWHKSRSKNGGYCFRANGYGYSKSDHCIKSLYYWLGYTNDEIYEGHKIPRVERLN